MPDELQRQLDDRLRQTAYSEVTLHVEWLASQGFEVSRSTIYQYSLSLRSLDAASGNIPALMLEHSRGAKRQRDMSGCEPVGVRGEIVEELLAWGARRIGLFGPCTVFAS